MRPWSSEDLDREVALLRDELRRANLVLGAVPAGAAAGARIWNELLVQQLAADLVRHLYELEYYKFKGIDVIVVPAKDQVKRKLESQARLKETVILPLPLTAQEQLKKELVSQARIINL